jgi:hypothetical protein
MACICCDAGRSGNSFVCHRAPFVHSNSLNPWSAALKRKTVYINRSKRRVQMYARLEGGNDLIIGALIFKIALTQPFRSSSY